MAKSVKDIFGSRAQETSEQKKATTTTRELALAAAEKQAARAAGLSTEAARNEKIAQKALEAYIEKGKAAIKEQQAQRKAVQDYLAEAPKNYAAQQAYDYGNILYNGRAAQNAAAKAATQSPNFFTYDRSKYTVEDYDKEIAAVDKMTDYTKQNYIATLQRDPDAPSSEVDKKIGELGQYKTFLAQQRNDLAAKDEYMGIIRSLPQNQQSIVYNTLEKYKQNLFEIENYNNLPADQYDAKRIQQLKTENKQIEDALKKAIPADYSGIVPTGNPLSGDSVLRRQTYAANPAQVLLDTAAREANAKIAEQDRLGWEKWTKEHPVIANIGSVLAQFVSLFDVGEVLSSKASGRPLDTNSMPVTQFRDTVRSVTSEKILKETESNVLNFLYQTGMSMADFASMLPINAATGGSAEWLTLGLMGTNAGLSAIKEGKERGLSDDAAIETGILAGVFETLFEKVSLETLINPGGAKSAASYILKNFLAEGSEEVATDIANFVADNIRNGGLSEYNSNIRAYMTQGMSYADARSAAQADFAKQVALSGLGGAISGGIMGSFGAAFSPNIKAQIRANANPQSGLGTVGNIQFQRVLTESEQNSPVKAREFTDIYNAGLKGGANANVEATVRAMQGSLTEAQATAAFYAGQQDAANGSMNVAQNKEQENNEGHGDESEQSKLLRSQFSGIQEESRNESFEDIKKQRKYATADEGLRQRLGDVSQGELETRGYSSGDGKLYDLTDGVQEGENVNVNNESITNSSERNAGMDTRRQAETVASRAEQTESGRPGDQNESVKVRRSRLIADQGGEVVSSASRNIPGGTDTPTFRVVGVGTINRLPSDLRTDVDRTVSRFRETKNETGLKALYFTDGQMEFNDNGTVTRVDAAVTPDGDVYINLSARDDIEKIFGHEEGHARWQQNGRGGKALKSFKRNAVATRGQAALDATVNAYATAYYGADTEMTNDVYNYLVEEIYCDARAGLNPKTNQFSEAAKRTEEGFTYQARQTQTTPEATPTETAPAANETRGSPEVTAEPEAPAETEPEPETETPTPLRGEVRMNEDEFRTAAAESHTSDRVTAANERAAARDITQHRDFAKVEQLDEGKTLIANNHMIVVTDANITGVESHGADMSVDRVMDMLRRAHDDAQTECKVPTVQELRYAIKTLKREAQLTMLEVPSGVRFVKSSDGRALAGVGNNIHVNAQSLLDAITLMGSDDIHIDGISPTRGVFVRVDFGYSEDNRALILPVMAPSTRYYRAVDDHTAALTDERLNKLFEQSPGVDYKANEWLTTIDPADYLAMTLRRENQVRSRFDIIPNEYGSTMENYDYLAELKRNPQTPYLVIDLSNNRIVGHEGRHRMRALEQNGITSAEIVVRFQSKNGQKVYAVSAEGKELPIDVLRGGEKLETIPSLTVKNQSGTRQTVELKDIMPINKPNRDAVMERYGASNAEVRYYRAVDAATDKEYLELAQEPKQNEEELREMVDEAATNAGYTEKWAHGSPAALFTSFDINEARGAKAIFLSDRGTASQYAATTATPLETRLIGKPVTTIDEALFEIKRIDDAFHQPTKDGDGYRIGRTHYSQEELIDYANRLRRRKQGGVYQLYVNFGKRLDVDAKGKWWNEIKSEYGQTTDQIGRWALHHGYDSVLIENVHDGGFNDNITSDVVLVFNPNQLKSTAPVTYDNNGNAIPLSERFDADKNDIRFYRNVDEYFEQGEIPSRDIEILQGNIHGNPVTKMTRTIAESSAVSDEQAQEIKRTAAGTDKFEYEIQSNKASVEKAQERLDRMHGNLDAAYDTWEEFFDSNKFPKPSDMAYGELLLMKLAEQNDERYIEVAAQLSSLATKAGQAVQAVRILKSFDKLSATTNAQFRLRAIESALRRLNNSLRARLKNRFNAIEISSELRKALLSAKSEEDIRAAADRILDDIASRVPNTFMDKWNAWRMLAMLGNPRTHIRNIVGNAVFVPAIKMKNLIGAALERAILRNGQTKTKYVGRINQEYKDYSQQAFKRYEDVIQGNSTKYEELTEIQLRRKIFGETGPFGVIGKFINRLSRFNTTAMELEDKMFLKRHFKSALAGYLQANNIDLNKMTSKQESAAIAYAIKEAQKATYRDASAVASALNRFSRANKATALVTESLMPFKKTPINILKRGVEYSPAGLLNTLSRGLYQLHNGNITINEWIDGIAAGMTGSLAMLIGAWLGSMGLLKGGQGDDDEYEKLIGEQPYSVQILGKSYTLDWAAPMSIPLFAGVNLYNSLADDGADVNDIWTVLQELPEPMIQMSLLQGINDAISSVRYAKGAGKVSRLATSMITGYLSQAFPTVGGQISRTIDSTARRNLTDPNSAVPDDIQYFIQQVMGKIPLLSFTKEPRINAWGEEDTTENPLLRGFENFLSPGYINDVDENDVEKELRGIAKATGKQEDLPQVKGSVSITVDGEQIKLSPKQVTAYQQTIGQRSYDALNNVITTERYQELEPEQKADVVGDIYTFITEGVQQEQFGKSMSKSAQALHDTFDADEYAAYLVELQHEVADNDGANLKQQDYIDALQRLIKRKVITRQQADAIFHSRWNSDKNNPFK